LSGPTFGQDQGQQTDRSEPDAATRARLEQRKAFGERMRNAGSMEERMKMMEEIRAMDRQRALDGFKRQLDLSDQEWTVVKPRIEAVYNLVHPQPRMRAGAGPEMSEVDRIRRELRELLENRDAPASQIKTRLTSLRAAKEKANQELAQARQDLRQLMTLRQEAVLVLGGLLE
jgi:chromosome segregation ATPase